MDIDINLLISLVENRPVLWDKSQECYKNKQLNVEAWKEIFIQLNENFETTLTNKERHDFGKIVIKKWNNVRDNWMKFHKNMKKNNRSNLYGIKKGGKKYRYYDQMQFLKKVVSPRTTKPTINEKESVENTNEDIALVKNEPNSPETYNEFEPTLDNFVQDTEKSKRKRTELSESEADKPIILIGSRENKNRNRVMDFFNSIAPTIDKFSDEDIVEFQYEVVKAMRRISRKKQALQVPFSFQNTSKIQENNTFVSIRSSPSTSRKYYDEQQQLKLQQSDACSESSICSEVTTGESDDDSKSPI